MFLPRFLTTVIGLPFLLAVIYFGSFPFYFFVLGVVFLGLREFFFLSKEAGYPAASMFGVIAGCLLCSSIFLNGISVGHAFENQATSAAWTLILIGLVFRGLYKGPSEMLISEWSVTLFGIVYVAWTLSHLLLIRDLRPGGQALTFFFFTIIWTMDIVAYLVGSRWGRHPLAKVNSPKKTWEGTAGGMLAVLLMAWIFEFFILPATVTLFEALLVAFVIAAVSVASDISESLLKRCAGVKDSSPLLPGHGGILDRFDAIILTAPLFYYYWAIFRKF